MGKKNIKEYIVFAVIAVISAGLILSTTQIGKEKYYPYDDSRMQIVFFGDSNIANTVEGKTVSDRISELMECDVYNIAVGGTTAAKVNAENYFDRTADLFCLYNLSKIMEIEECQALWDFSGTMPYEEQIAAKRAEVLTGIRYDQIDYIVISYGANDYTAGISAASGANPYDETTYEGSLRSTMERIRKLCPDSTIIVSSITYCAYLSEDTGKQPDGYYDDKGGGTIEAYRDAARRVASEYENVIFMDNLELLGIDVTNYMEYVPDGVHFNETAQAIYTKHLVDIITEVESSKDE